MFSEMDLCTPFVLIVMNDVGYLLWQNDICNEIYLCIFTTGFNIFRPEQNGQICANIIFKQVFNWTCRNKLLWNLERSETIFFQEKAFNSCGMQNVNHFVQASMC